MLAITTPPFFRYQGEELCMRCESHKDNPFWACDICVNAKPKVNPRPRDGITGKRRYKKTGN